MPSGRHNMMERAHLSDGAETLLEFASGGLGAMVAVPVQHGRTPLWFPGDGPQDAIEYSDYLDWTNPEHRSDGDEAAHVVGVYDPFCYDPFVPGVPVVHEEEIFEAPDFTYTFEIRGSSRRHLRSLPSRSAVDPTAGLTWWQSPFESNALGGILRGFSAGSYTDDPVRHRPWGGIPNPKKKQS